MREVTVQDYLGFLERQREVVIEGIRIPLLSGEKIPRLEPEDFKQEVITVWSFPKRGDWATHRANYRGNWAPQIPRNLLLRYSAPGDLVLDQMVGGGTTLVECKLLGRRAIGVDVNNDAVMLTLDRLNFGTRSLMETGAYPEIHVYQGDARRLHLLEDESIDLIATHPPYANIIKYTRDSHEFIPGDLSHVRSIADFKDQMYLVAKECFRVLKPGKFCAILMGDTRRHGHYVPIAFRVLQAFLEAGFVLKEDIIKVQWNTWTERLWTKQSIQKNFLLIMHEHLFVFRKPKPDDKTRDYAESMKWW